MFLSLLQTLLSALAEEIPLKNIEAHYGDTWERWMSVMSVVFQVK